MGKRGRAAIVVLGDIGRSPRMQYHALSLATQVNFFMFFFNFNFNFYDCCWLWSSSSSQASLKLDT